MAFLKEYINKSTFLLIVGVWNSTSVFIGTQYNNPVVLAFIATLGNLIIAWLGVETGHGEPKEDSEA